jgi:hypothetical protein
MVINEPFSIATRMISYVRLLQGKSETHWASSRENLNQKRWVSPWRSGAFLSWGPTSWMALDQYPQQKLDGFFHGNIPKYNMDDEMRVPHELGTPIYSPSIRLLSLSSLARFNLLSGTYNRGCRWLDDPFCNWEESTQDTRFDERQVAKSSYQNGVLSKTHLTTPTVGVTNQRSN